MLAPTTVNWLRAKDRFFSFGELSSEDQASALASLVQDLLQLKIALNDVSSRLERAKVGLGKDLKADLEAAAKTFEKIERLEAQIFELERGKGGGLEVKSGGSGSSKAGRVELDDSLRSTPGAVTLFQLYQRLSEQVESSRKELELLRRGVAKPPKLDEIPGEEQTRQLYSELRREKLVSALQKLRTNSEALREQTDRVSRELLELEKRQRELEAAKLPIENSLEEAERAEKAKALACSQLEKQLSGFTDFAEFDNLRAVNDNLERLADLQKQKAAIDAELKHLKAQRTRAEERLAEKKLEAREVSAGFEAHFARYLQAQAAFEAGNPELPLPHPQGDYASPKVQASGRPNSIPLTLGPQTSGPKTPEAQTRGPQILPPKTVFLDNVASALTPQELLSIGLEEVVDRPGHFSLLPLNSEGTGRLEALAEADRLRGENGRLRGLLASRQVSDAVVAAGTDYRARKEKVVGELTEKRKYLEAELQERQRIASFRANNDRAAPEDLQDSIFSVQAEGGSVELHIGEFEFFERFFRPLGKTKTCVAVHIAGVEPQFTGVCEGRRGDFNCRVSLPLALERLTGPIEVRVAVYLDSAERKRLLFEVPLIVGLDSAQGVRDLLRLFEPSGLEAGFVFVAAKLANPPRLQLALNAHRVISAPKRRVTVSATPGAGPFRDRKIRLRIEDVSSGFLVTGSRTTVPLSIDSQRKAPLAVQLEEELQDGIRTIDSTQVELAFGLQRLWETNASASEPKLSLIILITEN